MQFHAKESLEDELIEESLSFACISFLYKSAEPSMGSELVDGMKRSAAISEFNAPNKNVPLSLIRFEIYLGRVRFLISSGTLLMPSRTNAIIFLPCLRLRKR